jgi:Na+-transporting methylmalonyl-CoA/oxaloacetate decarboxylase gamma subunit
MQRKPFILLMLLTMSAASHAAARDFDSFMGVGWVWILGLSIYAVIAVVLPLALCRTAAASDASEEKTYEAMLKAGAAAGASMTAVAAAAHSKSNRVALKHQGLIRLDSRFARRRSLRLNRLDLNLADFASLMLDIHVLDNDEIVVRDDDVAAPELRKAA